MGRTTEGWILELEQLAGLIDGFQKMYAMHPNPNDEMTNGTRGSMQGSPFGEFVRDFDRIDTEQDAFLANALRGPAELMRTALNRDLPWSTSQCIADLTAVAEAMGSAIISLRAGNPGGGTPLDKLIQGLENDYMLSLAVTLTGQTGIVQTLDKWRESRKKPVDAYLDVTSFELVAEPGTGRILMRDLEIATDSGYTTFVIGEGFKDFEKFPAIQSMLYGQWFAYIFSLWEEQYRGQIARAHGLAPDGEPWTSRDISSPLFGDIRRIRNDFIHNKGVVDEASDNEVLTWFKEGETAKISAAQMLSLVELFPREELSRLPTRAGKGNPQNFPWPVDPDLVQQVRQIAADRKMTKAMKRDIGNEALRQWIHQATGPENTENT